MITEYSEEEKKLREVTVESKKVFDGRLLHVRSDKVRLPDGSITGREYITHHGAACVVPVTEKGTVIAVRQFRYPYGAVITEIPAGKLDGPGEDGLEAAKRELEEETGYTAAKWTDLGVYYPSAAYSNEKVYMYLAEDLLAGESRLDEGEFLNVIEIPLKELTEAVMNGDIPDGKTQAAVLKAARILGI